MKDPRAFPNYVDLLSADADRLLERLEERVCAAMRAHDHDAALELVVRLRHLSRCMDDARHEFRVLAALDFDVPLDDGLTPEP